MGLATVHPLAWDSEFFGTRMGRLGLIVHAPGGGDPGVADRLVAAALEGAGESGLEHLSTRIDVQDVRAVHSLEGQGFRLMDTLFAYAFIPGKCRLPELERVHEIRPCAREDHAAVMDIAAAAFENYPSRFSVDPHVPRERARDLYLEWARKCCTGELADWMLVAERRGRVVGFLAWRLNLDLYRHTGLRVVGGGIGACYPIRFAAFRELLWHATRYFIVHGEASDYETQSFNMANVSLYEQLGFRYARARYSFHCWLGR